MFTKSLFAASAGALLATPALAERPTDRYWAHGGAFFTSSDSNLRLDNVRLGSSGTTIDLETDIGLPQNKTLPYGGIGFRLGKAFRVEGEYFKLSRSGNRNIDRAITIGDTTYAAKANVSGTLESTTYRLKVDYSPYLTDTAELGFGLGFHITDFGVGFVGQGSVSSPGGTATSNVASESASQLAPLPTISGYGTYVLSPMFAVHGRADWFALKIDGISGSLVELQADVTARLIKNVGVGAGYRYINYIIKGQKNDFSGRLQYEFRGPVIFVEVAF